MLFIWPWCSGEGRKKQSVLAGRSGISGLPQDELYKQAAQARPDWNLSLLS